jgi:hypothetical protein
VTISFDALGLLLAQEINTGGSLRYVEAVAITFLFLALFGWIGGRIATDIDRPWIQRFVVWGYLAKVFGSLARYWMVTGLYEAGDSYSYHFAGQGFATVWRSLNVPVSTSGGQGTAFTEVVTGFLYAIYRPTFLGGFLIFATLAFVGQLLFYTAFRRWFGPTKQRLYAIAVFFFPSLVFWPSSIGKDALMVCFLGIAAYGASRLLFTYKIFGSGLIIALGLVLAAGVRPHVAGMFAISLVLAVLLGKAPDKRRGIPKKPVILIGAVAGAALVLATFSTTFEVGIAADSTQGDIGDFLEDVSQQTAQGGSQIEGIAITTPSRLPIAIVTVLFRPLIHEGTNLQMLISALEGTALLFLVIWKFPQIWRNKGLLRRKAYMTMCCFYTGGFIIGFSAINNLGILARQRVQLIPLFLALVIGLGWPEEPEAEGPDDEDFGAKVPLPPRQPGYTVSRRAPGQMDAAATDSASPGESQAEEELSAPAEGTGMEPSEELISPHHEAPTVPVTATSVNDRSDDDSSTATAGEDTEPSEELISPHHEAPAVPVIAASENGRFNGEVADTARISELKNPEEKKKSGRHISREPSVRDRIRPLVVELRIADPEISIREIARRVEASPSTVRRVLLEEDLN